MQLTVGHYRITFCVLQVASLHLSSALFGDDNYWKATQKKKNCVQENLRSKYICDGIVHCEDESDEENCNKCQGRETLHCKNNRCIPYYLQCDGHNDCWDGSDEQDCNKSFPHKKMFDVSTSIEHFNAENYQDLNCSSESNVTNNNNFKLHMIAFKKSMPGKPLNGETVIFQHMKKVVFYIPGFMTDDLDDGMTMKNAIVTGTDDVDCVVLFDWRKCSYYDRGIDGAYPWKTPEDYFNIVTFNIPFVSNVLADFVHRKIPQHVKVHFIGFSLGGQVAGIAARTLKNNNLRTIERISAIDPAGPVFEYRMHLFPSTTSNCIRKTDATFVDVTHGYFLLGIQKEAGHLDVYIKDVDCKHPYCLHRKAFEVYVASITTCSQITCPYNNITRSMECDTQNRSSLSSLGYLADSYNGRGKHQILFYKNENGQKVSTGNCTEYLNVNLPAKYRICHSTKNCGTQPYLLECQVLCVDGNRVNSFCESLQKKSFGTGSSLATNKYSETRTRVSWIELTNHQKCGRPISCVVEKSVPVQYYMAYKKPHSLDYFYIFRSELGNSVTKQMGNYPISYRESVLGQTLSPIYEKRDSIAYIMWNDEQPFGTKNALNITKDNSNFHANRASFGYSKGVFAYEKIGGFVLSHSIPRFPPHPDTASYEYPMSGKKFAQMAVCVSGEKYNKQVVNEIKAILDLLINFKPQVYALNALLDSWATGIREQLQRLIYQGKPKLGSPVIENKVYGQRFIKIHSFGQSDSKNFQDSFKNLAEHYKTPVFAKTWSTRYNTLFLAKCNNSTTVENIESVYNLQDNSFILQWNHMADNSTWLVSKKYETSLFCAGDLNREITTTVRGGMFICIQDADFYDSYLSIIHFDLKSCYN